MDVQPQNELSLGKAIRVDQQKAILIVEDEKLVAWDIEQTLRDHDCHDLFHATSVRGARELVHAVDSQISLVILDLKLDDGDASALIDEFTDRDIAVLVVTGYSGFAHPDVPVLYKPFGTRALLEAIASLLPSRCCHGSSIRL